MCQHVDGRIILQCNLKKLIYVTRDGYKWCALLNMVKNPWIPQHVGNSLTRRETVNYSSRTLLHTVISYIPESKCMVIAQHSIVLNDLMLWGLCPGRGKTFSSSQ